MQNVSYEQYKGKAYLLRPIDFAESFGLLFVKSGLLKLVLGSEVITIPESHAVVLPENVMLFAYAEQYAQIEVLSCPTLILQQMMQKIDAELFSLFMLQSRMRPYLLSPESPVYNDVKDILSRVEIESQLKDTCHQLMLHAEIGRLIATLLRQYATDKTQDDRLLYHNLSRMQKALIYIEEHLSEKISLTDLGEMVHLSPDYFSHLLDISTGKTAKQYLHALRMNKAMYLLIHTKISIGEVAERVGYKGSTFFSTLFYRTVGMSPSDYRELFAV